MAVALPRLIGDAGEDVKTMYLDIERRSGLGSR